MSLYHHIHINNAPIRQTQALNRKDAHLIIGDIATASHALQFAIDRLPEHEPIRRELQLCQAFLIERIEHVTLMDD